MQLGAGRMLFGLIHHIMPIDVMNQKVTAKILLTKTCHLYKLVITRVTTLTLKHNLWFWIHFKSESYPVPKIYNNNNN